jgi:hypothetical protein
MKTIVNGIPRELPPQRPPEPPRKPWSPDALMYLAFAIYMTGQILGGLLILFSKAH